METEPHQTTVQATTPPVLSPMTDAVKKQEIYRIFIDYYAMPDPDKAEFLKIEKDAKGRYTKQPTLGAFAEKYGVHRNTLGAWKKLPEFLAAVDKRQMEWGLELLPNVMAALYRRCVRYGISSDVELFLAYFKQWDRRKILQLGLEKFDEGDIRSLLAVLPKERQDHFHGIITSIIAEAQLSLSSGEVQDDSVAESGGGAPAVGE